MNTCQSTNTQKKIKSPVLLFSTFYLLIANTGGV